MPPYCYHKCKWGKVIWDDSDVLGGRGHWAVYYTSTQSPMIFIRRLNKLETFIEFELVG